ncbi:hypothetical protein N7486_009599 [Penicillium sp. IBT 16267x]|nr:hypothetical protein N7486_009599 [Penicillium sp. IBT 16267x]
MLQFALPAAASSGCFELIERILTVGATWPSEMLQAVLPSAASSGCLILERILALGADANGKSAYNGFTLLQAAAGAGQPHIIDKLLTAGADVNYVNDIVGFGAKTALQAAIIAGYEPVILRLRKAGAGKRSFFI